MADLLLKCICSEIPYVAYVGEVPTGNAKDWYRHLLASINSIFQVRLVDPNTGIMLNKSQRIVTYLQVRSEMRGNWYIPMYASRARS